MNGGRDSGFGGRETEDQRHEVVEGEHGGSVEMQERFLRLPLPDPRILTPDPLAREEP